MENIKPFLPDFVQSFADSPQELLLGMLVIGIVFAVGIGVLIFILSLLLKLNKRIFDRLEKKHGKQLQFQFMERVVAIVLFIIFIVIPLAGDKLSESILGSTAVIAAVVGIAAQDVLKDMFSGLNISIYKPFDVGDRIELEDGTVGVVESITMRHVVLNKIDNLKIVIPNSMLNHTSVLNYSYNNIPRGIRFSFPVSYDSDIKKTKTVIAEAIKNSPLSVPGLKDNTDEPEYAPVYFFDIKDSALIMSVTVYCQAGLRTEIIKDDIYTRVFEALMANDIEIPYNYMNLVMRSDEKK